MLTDLAASLWGLQCQPFPAGLLATFTGPQAAVMGAVAGRGEQTCLVKFLPLAHLYVPVGQRKMLVRLDVFFFYWKKSREWEWEGHLTWGLWVGRRWWWEEGRCPSWIRLWQSGTVASPWRRVWLYDDTSGPAHKIRYHLIRTLIKPVTDCCYCAPK